MTGQAEPPKWAVFITEPAKKQIDDLPSREQQRIRTRLIALCAGLDRGEMVGDIRKLQGEDDTWRLRSGDYRALFGKDEEKKVVVVLKVGHRRDIYR